MINQKTGRPFKPYVPRALKSEWEYVFIRGAWLILPKAGVKPKHSIKEVKAIINTKNG